MTVTSAAAVSAESAFNVGSGNVYAVSAGGSGTVDPNSAVLPELPGSLPIPFPDYPDGSTWNGTFDGATQCMGFAYYVYYFTHNGKHCPDQQKQYYEKNLNYIDAKKLFLGTPCGTYIRVKTHGRNGDADHSIAIISTTDTAITVYHANYGEPNKVEYKAYTWSDFAEKFFYLYHYVK